MKSTAGDWFPKLDEEALASDECSSNSAEEYCLALTYIFQK